MSLKVENQISNSFSKVDGKECSFWKRMEFLKKNKEYIRIKKNRTEFLSSFSSHFMLCLGGQSRNCSTFQIIPLLWHSSNSGSLTRIPEKSTELLFLWLLLLNFRPNRNSNEFFSLLLRSNSMAGVKSTHAHEKKKRNYEERQHHREQFMHSSCVATIAWERNSFSVETAFLKFNVACFSATECITLIFLGPRAGKCNGWWLYFKRRVFQALWETNLWPSQHFRFSVIPTRFTKKCLLSKQNAKVKKSEREWDRMRQNEAEWRKNKKRKNRIE